MRAAVKKWGNSASVRIPASILKAVQLDFDDPVEVREEGGRIAIEPLQRRECDIVQLVKGISRRKIHKEVDFARPVGNEVC